MATKTTPTTVPDHTHSHFGAYHYTHLATITAGLFVGVLALMTFLLTAGLQHPQPLFSWFVYASIIVLPLSLIIYTIGHSVQQAAPAVAPKDKPTGWTNLRIIRLIQQVLFVISIIVVTGLALVSAHIFFTPAPAPSQSQQQSQQVQ